MTGARQRRQRRRVLEGHHHRRHPVLLRPQPAARLDRRRAGDQLDLDRAGVRQRPGRAVPRRPPSPTRSARRRGGGTSTTSSTCTATRCRYWYAKETNQYARNNDRARRGRPTTAAATWTTIDYGTAPTDRRRADSRTRARPRPMRVDFAVGGPLPDATARTHDAAHWPDTPWDQECTGDTVPATATSPTFWTTKRLATVTTQVRDGSRLPRRGALDAHPHLPRPRRRHPGRPVADEDLPRPAWSATTTSVPAIKFTGMQLPNRVDTIDHSPPMNWWRIAAINTETGGTSTSPTPSRTASPASRCPTRRRPTPSAATRCAGPRRATPTRSPTGSTSTWSTTDLRERPHRRRTAAGQPADRLPVHLPRHAGLALHRRRRPDRPRTRPGRSGAATAGSASRSATPGEQTYTETRYFRGMHGDKPHRPAAPGPSP